VKRITPTKFKQYARDPMAFIMDLVVPGADPTKKQRDVCADFQFEAYERLVPCLQAVAHHKMPPDRGIWIERTKGASKDSDVGCCLLWMLIFSRRPILIEIGAEQQEQAAETLLAMQSVVRLNPWMAPLVEFQKSKVIGKQTEAVMDVLTTTSTGAHGSRPNMTVCNELSHVTNKDFMETMADNADKIGNNFMLIATNAGHLQTWQHDWREEHRQSGDWWFQKVEEPAPWIPQRNVRGAKMRNTTLRFNRLWRGIWSATEANAIDADDIEAAVRMDGPMTPKHVLDNGFVVIQGVDAGVQHDHAAVVHLAVQRGNPQIWLARCESWAPIGGRIALEQVESAILRGWADFPCLGCCFDPWQMEYIAERVRQRGVIMDPITMTGATGDEIARTVLEHFRNRLIRIYRQELFVRDLHRLNIEETKLGTYKLKSVRDGYGHADRAVAFVMALPAAALVARQPPIDEFSEAEHFVEVG